MSWMEKLCETYDANQAEIGEKLFPLYHITQQAQIEAVIDLDGNWAVGRSRVIIEKQKRTTLIPCTEKSACRTSAPEPHPLFDKLQYLTSEYEIYGVKKKYDYPDYIKLLSGWCDSPYALPQIRAIRTYLEKGTLISDLAGEKILYREGETFPEKWTKKGETPPIFQACTGGQLDAFVRFRVLGAEEEAVWKDPALWDSWIQYQNSQEKNRGICYVTGQQMQISELSPKKIRNSGDGAKLISSNDDKGFTFRGRFDLPSEAACVGRVTTEKAHNALRWLIGRQAYSHGDQVILSWLARTGDATPRLCADSSEFYDDFEEEAPIITNGEEFAMRFRLAIQGYSCKIKPDEPAAVIGLNSATPGRLSIFYYREMQASDLMERLIHWHLGCSWLHTYRFAKDGEDAKGKPRFKQIQFIGAPSPQDIIETAYGTNVGDKLFNSAMERLIPCIVDGAALPADLMRQAAGRAINAIALEDWEANKVLSIACALIRKYENDRLHKEVWTVALDENCNDRDYLFGRALAYAQKIEELAQWASGNEARQTNAERLKFAFSEHPARTWRLLMRQLQPYVDRMKAKRKGFKREMEMNEIVSRISLEGFDNKPLSPKFLLGYSTQLTEFKNNKKADEEIEEE